MKASDWKVNEDIELEGGVQYHIRCTRGDVSEYVLLPGDPGRISLIAKLLDHPKEVAYNREHRTITGYYQGLRVSATSTGMGCPSTAIAVEELIRIGAKVFVRVGSCGGFSDDVYPGDYILPTGAVALEGTSPIYMEKDPFCAAPDFDVLHSLYHSAVASGRRFHTGVILCHDALYAETKPFLQRWYERNVNSMEMESSILFTLGTLRNVKTGSFNLVGANSITLEKSNLTEEQMNEIRYHQHKIVLDTFKDLESKYHFQESQ